MVEDFLTAGDPLPQAGNFWIYLNSKAQPSCILRTEKVVIHKFKEVPVEIAIAEGEGDLTLNYWMNVHSELYSPYLRSWGIDDINDATVITEYFRVVHPK
ncbi:MAG: ASCH domain-containing protein [Pseudobdellovibrionaceae bacterium]